MANADDWHETHGFVVHVGHPHAQRLSSGRNPPDDVPPGVLIHAAGDDIRDKTLRRLEDSPGGGSAIYFGKERVGQAIDAPIPRSGSWKLARIADLSIAQSAYQLANRKSIWLPTQQSSAKEIQMATVADIGKIGPYHLDVSKRYSNGKIRGPFEIRSLQGNVVPTYPILWAHDADRERTMLFEADREGIPFRAHSNTEQEYVGNKQRKYYRQRHIATPIWTFDSTAVYSHAIYKTQDRRDRLDFNSTTEHEKALVMWGNTILALLMFWWHSSKQQPGRGRLAKTGSLPILDVTALSPEQLQHASQLFDETCQLPLKPIHELDQDENRKTARPALLRRSPRFARFHPR